MLYIDLTNFHLVNNNHGHEVGDAALRVVADRMRDSSSPAARTC